MKFTKIFFSTFLTVELIYFIFTFYHPNLPGWKMFSKQENTAFTLLNDRGEKIDPNSYLPPITYERKKPMAFRLAAFVCNKISGQSLILEFNESEKYKFEKPSCFYKKI